MGGLGKILRWGLAAFVALLALPSVAGAAQIKAGVAVKDATWHVGASAGQYASGDELDENDAGGAFVSVHSPDPHGHSIRRNPSYGVQSRLTARAIVVEGADGQKFALVKNDLYIPQDLLWRRTAQILESRGIGIDRDNLTMASSHNHSSPMYSSTGWGVWVFQDVFDFRFFEYMATTMADAVTEADRTKVPVKVGASVTQHSFVQRNVPGPSTADDGTPAGFPNDYTDHDVIVVRFDRLSDGKPLANLVNYAVHPEDNEGNDLISADYLGPMERMADRGTGAVTIYTQGAVGNTEPEDNRWHGIHERANFSHMQYAQSEFKARNIASAIVKTFNDIGSGTPENPNRFVPMRSDFGNDDVRFADRWFPGPASHPYPGISSCQTDKALSGDPRFPIVGFPDCNTANESPVGEFFQVPTQDTGITTDNFQELGIPVPENYSAPSYTGLEEDVSVHLQAFRIGDILFTVCSCEQWADQSMNIKSRTDRVPGNQHNGYDWTEQCVKAGSDWKCRHPNGEKTISDALYRKIRAQVNKDATGWDSLANVPFAESEPTDPDDPRFWGNYSHDDTPAKPADAAQSATLGYGLTAAIGMANDYNGYIATYREYQRGDHYRKALTAWGPHSSDYMATRLVKMGRALKPGQPDPFPTLPGNLNVVSDTVEWPGGGAKVTADLTHNEGRAQTIGNFAANGMAAYEASLPNDLKAEVVKHPDDIERFGSAFFTWVGGSNYTDNPEVRVQRFTGGKWTDWADQSGEVPVTLKFPPADNRAAYRVGGERFEWTAHYEAFVSRYDLMDRPISTPPGSYRFLVRGRRQEGGKPVAYSLTSREFVVKPWTGVTIEGFGADGGQPGFKVGPRRTLKAFNIDARLGPIDYPDTWQSSHGSKIQFIKPDRRAYRDPAAPNDPDKFEWYCQPQEDDPYGCSFRPWLDVGDLQRVVFTFVSKNGAVDRVLGHKVGGEWIADRKLKSGEGVYIEAGDACDAYGNYNGRPTATVGNTAAVPDKPPAGFSCIPKPPSGDVPPSGGSGGGGSGGGGSGGGGSGGGGSGTSASNPLGLPPKTQCVDRRRFSFKIHQPPRQRIVNVQVFINGKRRYSKRASRITKITIKKLPTTGRYKVRIVALTNRGNRVISTRTYKNCKKGRPTTRVERGGKKS